MKIKRFILNISTIVYRALRPRGRRVLLFIPHHNCIVDKYDLFNYSSDNVLSLFHSVITDNSFHNYDLWLVYYHHEKKEQYKQYLSSFSRTGSFHLVYYKDKNNMNLASISFDVCFIAETCRYFLHKSNSQKVISLGYFTPFKSDQDIFVGMSEAKMIQREININKSIDYEISTSDLSSRVLSSDSLLFYRKFRPFGFPRNDVFYKEHSELRESLLKKIDLKTPVKHIICYSPTFRDYEKTSANNNVKDKTLFGNQNPSDDLLLETLLHENNAIIIVKCHSWQNLGIMLDNTCKHIINYADMVKDMNIGLYDIMAVSDCLITDYTSAVFDFLHRDKPILYYFYDYNKYKNYRGFSYNPIQSFCPGAIAYSFDQLLQSLNTFFSQSEEGKDEYREKRNYVNKLFNTYQDGNSCDRIKQFVKSLF